MSSDLLASHASVHALALGGGGLVGVLAHLFIWHLIWRAAFGLWHIPTVGPFLVIAIVVIIVALGVLRRRRGPRWWNNRGGSTGYGTGSGPRDW